MVQVTCWQCELLVHFRMGEWEGETLYGLQGIELQRSPECDLVKCQSCQSLSFLHIHPVPLTNVCDTGEKVSTEMPLCFMTHTASSLEGLSDAAGSRQQMLFPMFSQSLAVAWATHFDIHQNRFGVEYIFTPNVKDKVFQMSHWN